MDIAGVKDTTIIIDANAEENRAFVMVDLS